MIMEEVSSNCMCTGGWSNGLGDNEDDFLVKSDEDQSDDDKDSIILEMNMLMTPRGCYRWWECPRGG